VVDGIDVDALAAAVRTCAGVECPHGGRPQDTATYLPGRRVEGCGSNAARWWCGCGGICRSRRGDDHEWITANASAAPNAERSSAATTDTVALAPPAPRSTAPPTDPRLNLAVGIDDEADLVALRHRIETEAPTTPAKPSTARPFPSGRK
jgi:hypothetical protein